MLTRRMLPSARESLAVPVGGAPVARTPLGHARRHERSGPTGSPQPTADRVRRSQNISSVPYLSSRYIIYRVRYGIHTVTAVRVSCHKHTRFLLSISFPPQRTLSKRLYSQLEGPCS